MLARDSGQTNAGHETASFAKALRDCLACGIIAVNGHGKITAFNFEAGQLTRLAPESVLNQPADLLPAILQELIRNTLAKGESVRDLQIRLPDDTPQSHPVQVHTAVLTDDHGKIAGAITVLNDLTLTRKLAQNLRRLDRLANLGTLSTSMAHEIKNGMVAVKTFVDLLLEKNQDAELAAVVGREMTRMDSLVTHMLRFASPAKPSFASVRLHEIIDHSLRLVQHQLESKAISLHRNFTAAPEVVSGNDYHLEQAFINLFLNAVEAMEPHGQLAVTTAVVQTAPTPLEAADGKNLTQLRVSIRDNGIGIPAENMNRLFEPFFTTKKDGTGLGLSIARRIVHEHGGAICAESEPGKGTTFNILLPLPEASR